MRSAVVLALGLLTIGCNYTSPTEVVNANLFDLRFGESVSVGSPPVQITFSELVEESRCPRSVACGWAGNAKIRLDLTTDGLSSDLFLNTHGGPQFRRDGYALGYRIRLDDLRPYPEEPGLPDRAGYMARLQVTRE